MRRQFQLIVAAFMTMVMVLFTTNVYAGDYNFRSIQNTIVAHQSAPHVNVLVNNASDVVNHTQHLLNVFLTTRHRLHQQVVLQTTLTRSLVYRVQPGDTLWSIAHKFQSTVENIQHVNHLASALLLPGQLLQIRIIHRAYGNSVIQTHARLLVGAPEFLIPVYQSAGKKFGIPWTILAAIHKEETDFSVSGNLVSCAGAEGPMQFMPATFAAFAVGAPGQSGAPNIDNVYDAIYTTAHMLAEVGYCKNPIKAIYAYNHSMDYVRRILHLSAI